MYKHLISLFVLIFLVVSNNVGAASLSKQRQMYMDARHALATGKLNDFNYLASQLKDYPLYPYLRYEELRRRISSAPEKDIREFLDNYSYVPVARRIRNGWLDALMKRGQHTKFQQYYVEDNNSAHQCFDLQARMMSGDAPQSIREAETLWLVGTSQPNQCDPIFSWMKKRDLMTDELIWQRIDLAMDKRDLKLAKYLATQLSTEQVHWFALLNSVHNNPKKIVSDPDLQQDHPIARKIIAHGARRWARKDVPGAANFWRDIRKNYKYSYAEHIHTQADIALTAAIKHHPLAAELMRNLPADIKDVDVQQWRARAAMRDNDWPTVLRSIVLMDFESKKELEWKYWRARALEEMGIHADAKFLYDKLAQERDYYGFLAADRVQKTYVMNNRPLQFTDFELGRMFEYPPLVRARELLEAGQTYHAYQEWKHLTAGFDEKKLRIAAYIAHQWDWYHTAIFTVARAKHYDDLQLRFPRPYDNIVFKKCKTIFIATQNMCMAVMRQESAMNSHCKITCRCERVNAD